MNRRKFLKNSGAALSGTALYFAGQEVNPALAKSITQNVNQHDFPAVPYVRQHEVETSGLNWEEWGTTLIPYTHVPTVEESYRLYQPHNGLAFMVSYMVGNVMDKQGNKYNLFREYKAFDSLNSVATLSIPDGVTLAQSLFKPGESYLGKCNNDMIDEKTFQVQPYLVDPNLMTIVRGPQRAQWMDLNGRVNLEYKTLGPALEYFCPGLVEDTMYRSEQYWVKGTVDGKDVQGYGVIDTAWGTPGIAWEQSKIFRYLEEAWVVWCNVFEDGSKECGVFMDGVDKFGCGYYNRDGEASVAGQSKAEVFWTPDGFLQGANFAVGNTPFVFKMDARIVQVPNFLNWASGTVSRVGETRTPKMSFAWLEFLPKR